MDYRLKIPNLSFGTVLADPPWSLSTKGPRRKMHYDRMTLSEIKAMPVSDATSDDAHLWLWTTNPHLPEALEVVTAWGFEYRSMMTWAKPHMGLGWWLRSQTEHIILASKTKRLRSTPRSITTLLNAPTRKHSQKPDAIYPIIEELSPGPYCELFSRGVAQREGWTFLGSDRPAQT